MSASALVLEGVVPVVVVCTRDGTWSVVGSDGVVVVVMVCIIDGGCCGSLCGLHEDFVFCVS